MDSLTIRAQIKSLLEAAGADNVYTEDPKLIDWETVIDMLRQQDKQYIQAWVIRRVGSVPWTSEDHHGLVPIGCVVQWHHTFNIMMFFGYIEGSSEDQMQALIDTVLTYMQDKRTLNSTVFGVEQPMSLESVQPSELGGVGGYTCTFVLRCQVDDTGVNPQ